MGYQSTLYTTYRFMAKGSIHRHLAIGAGQQGAVRMDTADVSVACKQGRFGATPCPQIWPRHALGSRGTLRRVAAALCQAEPIRLKVGSQPSHGDSATSGCKYQ